MGRLLETKIKYISELEYKSIPGNEDFGKEYGTLIKMLKEVLVEGFGDFSISNITFEEDTTHRDYWLCHLHTDAKATEMFTVIEIKGSDLPILNKEHRVQYYSPGKITIAILKSDVSGTPTASVASMRISYPPFGWKVKYEKPSVLVLGLGDEDLSNFFLRIEDKVHPTLGKGYMRYAIISAYTQMEDADDIGYNPSRNKMPFHPENPQWPEKGLDGSNAGVSFGYSGILYGLNMDDYHRVHFEYRRGLPVDDFDIIGDNKTIYLNALKKSSINHLHVFGAYKPVGLNTAPFVINPRKRNLFSNSWLDSGMLGFRSGGYVGTFHDERRALYFPYPDICANMSDLPLFLFNRNSTTSLHKKGAVLSGIPVSINFETFGSGWNTFSRGSWKSLTLTPVTIRELDGDDKWVSEVVGTMRGFRHIVEEYGNSRPYTMVTKQDNRFFGIMAHYLKPVVYASSSAFHQHPDIGLIDTNYNGYCVKGAVAFPLDTWDE